MRGRLQEGLAFFAAATDWLRDQTTGAGRSLLNHVLAWNSLYAAYVWDFDAALPLARQALDIARREEDQRMIALSDYALGMTLANLDVFSVDAKRAQAQESLALFSELDERFWIARACQLLAYIDYIEGQAESGLAYTQRALDLRREAGEPLGIANSLINLGAGLQEIGQWDLAEQYTRESLEVCRSFGYWSVQGIGQRNLVAQCLFKHDLQGAEDTIKEGLAQATRQRELNHIVAFEFQRSLWYLLEGAYAEAEDWADRALADGMALASNDSSRFEAQYPRAAVGCGRVALGRSAEAKSLLFEALPRIATAPAANIALRYCLTGIAAVLADDGQIERALELLALVCQHPLSPAWWQEREPLTGRLLSDLRAQLSAEVCDAAWTRGGTFEMDTLIAALSADDAPGSARN